MMTDLIVERITNETDEYVSVICIKPTSFRFVLGECFLLGFPGYPETRVFSFSSSPTENIISIAYRKGISQFKQKLQELRTGDTLTISPFGSQFIFNENIPAVFIAGGIGITAFRSIIKYCVDKHVTQRLRLVFMNRTDNFPFLTDLQEFQLHLPQLSISFVVTGKEGRLDITKLQQLSIAGDEEFYVAGPPRMIDTTVELLQEVGIPSKRIHTESFDGYQEAV